jgi:23S rRNA pseudouridine955/2504/2580 synthase
MILFEDENIIAINKPSGYAVQGGPKVDLNLLNHLQFWQEPSSTETLSLAHRLDKDSTGVLILTKHTASARRLARMFSRRTVNKKYLALTVGVPAKKEGSICIPIMERNVSSSTTGTKRKSFRSTLCHDLAETVTESMIGKSHPYNSTAKVAKTEYKMLGALGSKCSLLEVWPLTGYKHQIRVHLAEGIHTPVAGDYKYGSQQFRGNDKLRNFNSFLKPRLSRGVVYLHAFQVVLPDYNEGQSLRITSPPTVYFLDALGRLGLNLPESYNHIIQSREWAAFE